MTTILGLSSALFALAAFIAACRVRGYDNGYDEGYKEGLKDGAEAGQIKACEWWSDAEMSVQKAREEIWKEEG